VAGTLLTGATGFIGSHLTPLLVERGDSVRVLVRQDARIDALHDVEVVRGDILNRRSVRRAMRGVERVFHVAGTTSLLAPRSRVLSVNVEGTRVVLQEALRADVSRVVYTSSVAAIGPAPPGLTTDETGIWDAGRYGIPYVDSKHEAEVEVLRLLARGLPVVIVNPTHVLGAGDPGRSSTVLVRRFLRRAIPAYVEGTLNIVGVGDVARGHVLADEHGTVGERYVLGNRNFTLDRLFADLGRLSGVEPPAVKLPVGVALALASAGGRLPGVPGVRLPGVPGVRLPGVAGVRLPGVPGVRLPGVAGVRLPGMPSAVEIRAASLNWAYRNTKAKRELGWRPGPHEDCLEETIEWYRGLDGFSAGRQPLGLRVTGGLLRRLVQS
jgi:dihydroflavonol-4-reductase